MLPAGRPRHPPASRPLRPGDDPRKDDPRKDDSYGVRISLRVAAAATAEVRESTPSLA